MPILGATPEPDYSGRAVTRGVAPTQNSMDFALSYQTGLDRAPGTAFAAALTLGVGDLVDTVSASVGLTERQDINQNLINSGFLQAVGGPGLTAWADENRGAIEVGSAIAGVVAADYLAGKLLKPASVAMKAIRGVPYVKNIATLDRQYERALRLSQLTNREVARRGMTGVERFSGSNMTFPYMGQLTTSRTAANKNLFGAAAKRGLARNVSTEAIMAATLNENSVLYSDDMGHNLAWMGAGLVAGGALDSLVTTYALRKYANSEQIRQLNRGAYDPTGLEGSRLHSFEVSDRVLKEAGYTGPVGDMFFQGGGGHTDRVTNLAVQAAELELTRGVGERASVLAGQQLKLATPVREQAAEGMQKVTVRGFNGVRQSGFSMGDKGPGAVHGEVIRESLVRDPMSMFGIEEVATSAEGGITQTFTLRADALKDRLGKIQQIHKDGGIKKKIKNKDGTWTDVVRPLTPEEQESLGKQMQDLIFKNSSTEVVMLEPGEWAPRSHGEMLEKYKPRNILREGGLGLEGKAIWSVERDKDFTQRLGLSNDLDVFLPDGKSKIEQLDPHEMIHMFHVGQSMVNHFKKTGNAIQVPENPTWFQLDLAEQLARETKDPNSVIYPGTMTRESAAVESFAQKLDIVKGLQSTAKAAKLTQDTAWAFKVKTMLNLPRIDSYTSSLMNFSEDPLDYLMASFKSGDDVRKAPHAGILGAVNQSRKILGLTDDTADSVRSLAGNSFNFMMTRDGKAFAPVLGVRRPLAPYQWSRDELVVRQALKNGHVRNSLVGETADPYSRSLAEIMTQDPSFGIARKVQELADDQHRSMVPGFREAAPQTTAGAFMNAFTSRARRDVDNPMMMAASRQQELKTRAVQAHVQEILSRNMGDSVSEITSTRNARSLMLINQFGTFRRGWQLLPKVSETILPNGERAVQFLLDEKSILNQRRFEQTFGRKLEKGQTLMTPEGRTVVLDELGAQVLQRMQGVHKETLAAKNTALRSQGLPEIRETPHYWPAPSLKGKYVGFTFDAERNAVPGMGIVADSPEQLAKLSQDMMKSDQWQEGYLFRTRDDVTSFMSLYDKAQMDFMDPTVNTAIQFNKSSTGTLAGNKMDEAAFSDALTSMRDALISHGDDVLEILHDDVIKSLQARATIAKVESAVGSRNQARHGSIFDRALQNLQGINALAAKDSLLGDISGKTESIIDGLLKGNLVKKPGESLAVAKARAGAALDGWIRWAKPGQSASGSKFDQFARELGEYMPYKSVNEMLTAQADAIRDPEIQRISAKLSWFEAGSRLRWLESAHAVVNMGSIIANTPAIIKALQPRIGETVAEAAARNSSIAMPVGLDNGQSIVLPNIPKLMWQGMRDQWKDSGDAVIEAAKKKGFELGFMDQEVAEFNAAWGAIESKTGFKKFFMGDANHEGTGLADRFIRNGGVDRALGVLSDKSEQISRQWGMQMGYRAGRAMGIDDPHQLNMFAHEITNKMIANYDPRNRPEIFQGALGSLAGLFQSYVFNFYERMFRYLETSEPGRGLIGIETLDPRKMNARPAAIQYAMQSAMFGVSSSPGWHALNWAFFDRGQGKGDDPVDSLYQRFGQADGDLLMHGVIGSLPKIFGAEGVNLYTRGDSEVRLPGSEWKLTETPIGSLPLPNLPVVDTLSRVAKGLSSGWSAVMEEGDVGLNHLAEIASNMITNRPLAGIIEQTATHGYDTSWDGQLVADTKTTSQQIYRILGVRSMAQQKQIDQFYMDKASQEEQGARKDVLNGLTRAAIRDKRFDAVPQLFERYVEEGGDPRYYTRWVKQSAEAALETRSERQLERALKDKTNRSQASIGRLLDGQVDVFESEQAGDDYGASDAIDEVNSLEMQTIPNAFGDPVGDRFPTDDQMSQASLIPGL